MELSTGRWSAWAAGGLFFALALFLLRDGCLPDHVMVSGESVSRSLPWAGVTAGAPVYNRFTGDQARIYYPYLLEAARVYAGDADALWTHRGGGGLPFLGNMTSSLLHPLTLLAAVLPVRIVPLVQGLAVLTLACLFTWLFLRRLGVGEMAALCGALAFGFGGHQVLWLQYALSHALLGLPACFWAVERVVEDRSRARVAVLALCFSSLALAGHPETAFLAGLLAALWALFRLWDAHGRSLVAGALVLALALSAVQWMPFVEYALASHGYQLRLQVAASTATGVTLGATAVFVFFALAAWALLRSGAERGLTKGVLAVSFGVVAVMMARRMGMSMSAATLLLPDLYGSPLGAGTYTGAQDYPGLNSAFVGALPPLLLAVGAVLGLGGGPTRFFAAGAALLWGAAHHMPGAEHVVRTVPGLSQVEPTRLLGAVGFLVACGGALVLDRLVSVATKPRVLAAVARVGLMLVLIVAGGWAWLQGQTDPHGGRTVISRLRSPAPSLVHDGTRPVTICFDLDQPADELVVSVDGRVLRRMAPAPASPPGQPVLLRYDAQRAEGGRHRLQVWASRGGEREILADQPLNVWRVRRVGPRDFGAAVLSLGLLGWLLVRRRPQGALWAACLVGLDVLSFGHGYNRAVPARQLFPPMATVDYLRQQPEPFRVFSEGTILPPDTHFAAGVDHILSYDNLGYHRTYQWLVNIVDMDAFASFSFSRENARYDNPRFDAIDVRYVLTDTATDLSDLPDMRLVHQSETRVWLNTGNLGRAFLVGQAMSILVDPADIEAVQRLVLADPAEVALLEQDYDGPLGGRGTARVTAWEGRRIEVQTDADGPALLVLAENRAPGWTARVDGGEPGPTLPCDVAWQAVPVPAGVHRVEFVYDPASWRWGLRISLAAAALCLGMLLVRRRGG